LRKKRSHHPTTVTSKGEGPDPSKKESRTFFRTIEKGKLPSVSSKDDYCGEKVDGSLEHPFSTKEGGSKLSLHPRWKNPSVSIEEKKKDVGEKKGGAAAIF